VTGINDRPRVAILGLGLIGGSLAGALKAAHWAGEIRAWGRRPDMLEAGLKRGLVDHISLDLAATAADADIIVICAPTLVAADLLAQLLELTGGRRPPPVITDVASVKGSLRAAATAFSGAMPANVVLGHPIAGSERSGVSAANPKLFLRHRVILTPEPETDPAALAQVRAMWEVTGAEVVDMPVEVHDEVLAATSHLPHVLAYALVDALAASAASEEIFRFAAGGFRDFTRIASSDPVMWRDISIANRDAMLRAIDDFGDHLATLRTAIEYGDADALLETFARAKEARDGFAALLAQRNAANTQTGD
jgi:cyclohexadieny/prephenate dehydrogenase